MVQAVEKVGSAAEQHFRVVELRQGEAALENFPSFSNKFDSLLYRID
jgi:hypothetical protein